MKKHTINYLILLILFVISFFMVEKSEGLVVSENIICQNILPNLTPNIPIIITSDDNFTDYGFPGDGSEELPFLIDSLEIVTTTSHNAIFISSTTKNFIIQNCLIDSITDGIMLENVTENTATIRDNFCIDHDYSGIRILSSPGTKIIRNHCTQSIWYGIRLQDSPFCSIINNTCYNNNEDGIMLSYSGHASIINNHCYDNGYSGINLSLSEYSLVLNNTCNNNHNGIRQYSSDFTSDINNTCLNNNNQGIYLYFSDECVVSNNTCVNNKDGITLTFTEYDILENNNCSSNEGEGIRLSIAESTRIINNTCVGNSLGLYFHEANATNIKRNTIASNSDNGVTFYVSTYSNLSENRIIDNSGNGVEFSNSKKNSVSFNLIQSNFKYGVYLSKDSHFNKIHHNTFVENNPNSTSQAHDDGENNLFYDKSRNEGNFWSDIKRKKEYYIEGLAENLDPYPLKNPIIPFIPTTETAYSEVLVLLISLCLITFSTIILGYRKKMVRINI